MKSIQSAFGGNQDFMPATKALSLDELFEEAGRLGKLETGSWEASRAELRVNFSGDDYVSLMGKKYQTLKENIADVIFRARKLKAFYESGF